MLQMLLGMLTGKAGRGGQGALLGTLTKMLTGGGGSGGLGGIDLGSILGRFQQAGMGGKVDSWVGSGTNEPLSSREVRQVVSDEELADLAKQTGLSKRQTADGLSKVLPDMVDNLSPDGSVLEGDALQSGLGSLGKTMGY